MSEAEFQYLDEVFAEYNADELRARMDDPQALLHELVDRHGTGRVIFRNTREALKGFPVRKARPVPLAPREELREEALQARLLKSLSWMRVKRMIRV